MVVNVNRAVILDVDGVMLRHLPSMIKVSRRIDKFVAKTAGVSNSHGSRINQHLYKTFGHTFVGLQKMYPKTITLDEFNDFVYTEDVIRSIHHSTYNVDVIEHVIILQRFLEACKTAGTPVYMFSNAPLVWCDAVKHAYNLRKWIPESSIISCQHDVFQGFLKPNPIVYETLQQYLRFEHQNDGLQFLYVDDSFVNLVPVLDKPLWKPILFEAELSPMASPKLYHASSFDHIYL